VTGIIHSLGVGPAWPFRDLAELERFLAFRQGIVAGDQERRVLFIVPPCGMAETATELARSLVNPVAPWSRIFGRMIAGEIDGILPLAVEEIPFDQGRLHVVHDWLVEVGDVAALGRLLEPMASEHCGAFWVALVAFCGLLKKPEEISRAVVVHLAELPAVVFEEPAETFAP